MKTRILSVLALLCLAALLIPGLASCSSDRHTIFDGTVLERTTAPTSFVCIEVKGYGSMILELYPDSAPITVKNFQDLVAEGFYNGKTFHRVINGFIIQGGAPLVTDKAHDTIEGEFSRNGVDNPTQHERGVISMARANSYDSASTQFFIVHKTEGATHLNGLYAAFGRVIDGIDVVDKIAAVNTSSSDKPIKDVVISEIYFVAEVTE